MSVRLFATILLVCSLAGTGSVACADGAFEPLVGEGALESHFGTDPFDPNNTQPELAITGQGAVPNSGGVDIFSTNAFTLDIGFLDGAYTNTKKKSFDNLFLTVAFSPDGGLFDSIRFFDPGDPSDYLEFAPSQFVDSQLFGLPFPPGGIQGIANGAGDFLSLNGALMAGIDLNASLLRDNKATEPPAVHVGVEVVNPVGGQGSRIRFDVFGLKNGASWNVVGNNPNSGAAGYSDGRSAPEPASLTLLTAGAVLLGLRRRRQRARKAK